MKAPTAFAAALVLLFTAAVAHAVKAPIGSETTVASGGAEHPDIAFNPIQDRYFVAWSQGGIVLGRVLRPDLSTVASVFAVSDPGAGGPPKAAYDGIRERYLVVWPGPAGQGTEVFGQRLDGNGSRVGNYDFQISSSGGTVGKVALVGGSRDDQFAVVWDGAGAAGTREVFMRLLTGAGDPLGPAIQLSDSSRGPGHDARDPVVAYNPDLHQYLAAWVQDRGPQHEEDPVVGRLVSAYGGGQPAGPVLTLAGTKLIPGRVADRYAPAVANRPGGGYLVTWTEVYDYTGPWVLGNSVTADGTYSGGDFQIKYPIISHDPVPIGSRNPALAFDPPSGQFELLWQGDTSEGVQTEDEIFGMTRYDGTPPFQVSGASGLNLHASDPAIAYNDQQQEHVVVWRADGPPGSGFQILARRIGTIPPPSQTVDHRAPRVRITIARRPHIISARGLVVRATCDEPCTLGASARATLSRRGGTTLGRVSKTVPAATAATLRIHASRHAVRLLRRAFRHRTLVTVRLRVTASDRAGNRRSIERVLRAAR